MNPGASPGPGSEASLGEFDPIEFKRNLKGGKYMNKVFLILFILPFIGGADRLNAFNLENFDAIRDTNMCPGCDLSGVQFVGGLEGYDLRDAILTKANLKNAEFPKVLLTGADLQGADLRNVNLKGAHLQNAQMKGTQLAGAHLEGADLTGAKNVNLKDAVTDASTKLPKSDIDLKKEVEKNVNTLKKEKKCPGCYLYGAQLLGGAEGIDLSKADLSNANLGYANLNKAKLAEANLQGAYISHANLSGANLQNTELSKAKWTGTKLEGADLTGAKNASLAIDVVTDKETKLPK